MLTVIGTGLSSLKTAYDIAKGLNAASTQASVNDVKIALQAHILEAQAAMVEAGQAQTVASQRIHDLEIKIKGFNDWDAQKSRYELRNTGQGSLAYHLIEAAAPNEPPHWICPTCYEDGKRSILKHETIPQGRAQILACHPCGFDVVTHGVRHETPLKARSSLGRR
jgi:hypothetical protein